MTVASSLQATQYRLARHYIDKLKQANAAFHLGRENQRRWVSQIENDWGQIKQWQGWAAAGTQDDLERASCCAALCMAGNEILRVRQSPSERLVWLRQGIDAAQKIKDGASECELLFELAQICFLLGKHEDAFQHGQHLLELAQEAGDSFIAGRAWYVQGQTRLHVGKLDEAQSCYEKSLALLEPLRAEAEFGRVLQGMGRVAMYRGDSRNAYGYFVRYLEIVEHSSREAERAAAYLTMNNVLLQLRDYALAKSYVERALQVCLATGFQRILPIVWLSLGATEVEMGELEAACHHFEKGIACAHMMQSKSALIELLWNLADAHMRQDKYPEAYPELTEALALARDSHILHFLCEIHVVLSRWHVDKHQEGAAISHLLEAIGFAQQLDSDNFLALVLQSSIHLWQQKGELEQAARWAGLLSLHPEYVRPGLFGPTAATLKEGLGTKHYQNLLEQGKTLTLNGVVADVQAALSTQFQRWG